MTEITQKRPIQVYVIDSEIKLTSKQAKFVYEYLKDYNGAQAAIRAKYAKGSAAVAASRLLTNANILQAINDGKWFYQYQNGIDADWIRKQMVTLFDRCIQAVPVMEYDPNEKRMVETGEYKFEVNGATKLLDMMAKDVGMMQQNVNVNVNGKVAHEHSIKDQMNFNGIRKRLDGQRKLKVVNG